MPSAAKMKIYNAKQNILKIIFVDDVMPLIQHPEIAQKICSLLAFGSFHPTKFPIRSNAFPFLFPFLFLAFLILADGEQ